MVSKTDNQRWTFKRKSELVVSILKNEVSLVDICRKHDLRQSELESWVKLFLEGGEQNLKTTTKERQEGHEKEVLALRAKVGELVLEIDARKKLQALIDQGEMSF
ncbi:MAG TPA: DUF1153 domain-containing protein [Candidatus Saccharimonadales bacterium]|nr:DUF1153 domain-containing protein [Candidatus Saccharimonadales bacterium]